MEQRACLYCGDMFEVRAKVKPKKYCSDRCRTRFFQDNRILEDCEPYQISICEYCGAEFFNINNVSRKYCSQAHYRAARWGKKPQAVEVKNVLRPLQLPQKAQSENEPKPVLVKSVTQNSTDKQQRDKRVEWARQKKKEGWSFGKIANELGISINTVKTWGRRYFDKEDTPTYRVNEEYFVSGECKITPLPIEVCELSEIVQGRIFLLGGLTGHFSGSIDNFVSKVPQTLSYNLQQGDVFVFCNKIRHRLNVLQWQGGNFALFSLRTEQEHYPLPWFDRPVAIEITRSDLELLIEYPRFMLRLKGQATPEFML